MFDEVGECAGPGIRRWVLDVKGAKNVATVGRTDKRRRQWVRRYGRMLVPCGTVVGLSETG